MTAAATTRKTVRAATVVAVLVLLTGCGASRVWVPPRLNLTEYRPTGLIRFTMENGQGSLSRLATERFAAAAFAGQDGIQLLELGDADSLLAEVGEPRLDARAIQAIGTRYDVPAVFVGHLVVSDVKPRGVVLGPRPHVEATVSVELTVRLLSTERGATLWTRNARATEVVGELGLNGGRPYFGAEHPEEAYGHLVDRLIYAVTDDLRPHQVRR
jgi:hypothetical protein